MKKITALWLCAILTMSAFISIDVGNNVEGKVIVRDGVTYIPLAPFRINSNADFATSPGVSGGDGSSGNPWIIENWDVDDWVTNLGYAIYIGNTTEHFAIKNCTTSRVRFSGDVTDYYFNSGIILFNTTNGLIFNNTVYGNYYDGLCIHYSDNIYVANNNVFSHPFNGIAAYYTNNSQFYFNNVNNVYAGMGFYFGHSNNNTILNNTVTNNDFPGIDIICSDNNTVAYNQIEDNNDYGINFYSSNNNSVHHNNLINNEKQAYDDSGNNAWNTPYPGGGNYWSDYTGTDAMNGPVQGILGVDGIGDIPYTNIQGGAGAQDNYPLMNLFTGDSVNPINPYWHKGSPITITAIATNAEYVELWYAYASTHGNYGTYSTFANDTNGGNGWAWSFTFPDGDGWYRFYSISGNVSAGERENVPITHDAECGYDITAPTSAADAISPSTTTATSLSISYTKNDAPSGVKNITLWYSYSSDGTGYGAWQKFGTESVSPTFADFNFNFSNGNGYYQFHTRATDFAGNWEGTPAGNDTWVLQDSTPPFSTAGIITPYWINTSPLPMTATASDSDNVVANVTLWYSYSPDNATWGAWTPFGIDNTAPWEWSFGFPGGQGYYEFYSIANDTVNNSEIAPTIADTSCAYDTTKPAITDNSPATGTTGDSYSFRALVTDNLNLSAVHVIYWFGIGTEINATMTHTTANNYELGVTIPLNILDTLHYQITAVDMAGNWNSTTVKDVAIDDNDDPIADAGQDQTVEAGTVVTLDGSASTDNIGITNCTWTFYDGVQNVTLYGIAPSHNFTVTGNHTVTLTVKDATGNSDLDTMTVTVTPAPLADSDGDGTPDDQDAFPEDPDEDTDTDSDGVGENSDAFPDDPNETLDTDGDGTGDNADAFPDDPDEDTDSDSDGTGDNADAFPTDPDEDTDTDGDGVGDNSDAFPDDPNKWEEETGGIGDYWWIILILIIVLTVGAFLGFKMAKGKKPDTPKPEEAVTENPIEEEFTIEQSTEPPKNE